MSLMRGTTMGLLAAAALVTGLGGCALPHVLPVETATTSGPSPYGVWYEQHWATNSVLLAAADDPNTEVQAEADDTAVDEAVEAGVDADASPEEAADAAAAAIDRMDTAVEASAVAAENAAKAAEDFDNSTPYQFPASSFAPQVPSDTVPGATAPEAAPSGDPIRY